MKRKTDMVVIKGVFVLAPALFLFYCGFRGALAFDDLALGATYKAGASFTSGEISIFVKKFFSQGGPIPGYAEVDTGNMPGLGNNIHLRNSNLVFGFDYPFREIQLSFADHGGSINLMVNGVLKKEASLLLLDGLLVNGITITVRGSDAAGVIIMRGRITEFMIGGRELWIDEIHYICW